MYRELFESSVTGEVSGFALFNASVTHGLDAGVGRQQLLYSKDVPQSVQKQEELAKIH